MGSCCAKSARTDPNPAPQPPSPDKSSSNHTNRPSSTHPTPPPISTTPADKPSTCNDANQTPPTPPTATTASPDMVSSHPTSLPPSNSPVPRPSSALPHPVPQPYVSKPRAFHVPSNLRQILDFSPTSTSPESIVKQALLSHAPGKHAISLVGMGGAGKTTILRAIGRDKDVMAKFSDGVWFFELGHDVKLLSFIRQMQTFIKKVFSEFLVDFKELTAVEDTHCTMINQLMEGLAAKKVLLLFDDVWDVNSSVYTLVYAMCTAVQGNGGTSLKILTSTRSGDVGEVPTHEVCIPVNPEDCDIDRSLEIFCCHACIGTSKLSSLSPHNMDAIYRIIESCGGLPLALSVAGSAVKQLMAPSTNLGEQNAFVEFWERLETNITQLADAESGERHKGLLVALQSSLQMLEKRWKSEEIAMEDMFRSFCIMEKQVCLPLNVIEKLWGVSTELVNRGVRMMARNSLVSLVWKNGILFGIRMHDLVNDLSVNMAKKKDEVRVWHSRMLDAYQLSTDTGAKRSGKISTGRGGWWDLEKNEKYMKDNLVRHLLQGAGRATEVLKLLTDYRWVEKMNEDEKRPPFQKIISELLMLRVYLEKHENRETSLRVMSDIDVIVRTMELCMVPHCMKNRKECTFQLYGRLSGVESDCGIVEGLVWSIEQYGQRPWARAGRSVLTSGRSLLKRVLELGDDTEYVSGGSIPGAGDDGIVGAGGGKLVVLSGRDGSRKSCAIGHEEDYDIVDICIDNSSGMIYSCRAQGFVIIWHVHKQLRCLEVDGLGEGERITCMQVLQTHQKLVLGTDGGRILLMDIKNGNVTRTIDAHAADVTSLAVGRREEVVVSASCDRTIRLWDTQAFEDRGIALRGHTDWVKSVMMSADGRLLISGSYDGSVRLWDAQDYREIWKSDEHCIAVTCVQISSDGRWLYSGDCTGKVCVWMVRNNGYDVSLVHSLQHTTMHCVESLFIGGHSELFVWTGKQIHVWGDFATNSEEDDVFLPHVHYFGISADEATMVMCNGILECIEIRSVHDVSQRKDRVVSSFNLPDYHIEKVAVSNDQNLVAYSRLEKSIVKVVDAHDGAVLHRFSGLESWVFSLVQLRQEGDSSPLSSSDDSVEYRYNTAPGRGVVSISFSSDDSIVSATAVIRDFFENSTRTTKSLSWNVLSGDPLDKPLIDTEIETSKAITGPRIFCKEMLANSRYYDSKDVTFEHEGTSFTIATLDEYVSCAHYCSDTSRLWFSRESGGLQHVDLVTDDTPFPPRDEPPLPPLPQSHLPPTQHTLDEMGTDTDAEEVEVYDVFISHAGLDKNTIAKPLYDLLVALGFKVFLDICELRPGDNAPLKMINAMKTAKIAVVILSSEFAARKWTMKELMCFLERFHAGGEREVIIIPVFYRLTLENCRDEDALFSAVDENGESVFMKEGFLQRMVRENEYGIRDVMRALQVLRSVTGIENVKGVTNGSRAEEGAGRMELVEEIVRAIVEAKERLENGASSKWKRTMSDDSDEKTVCPYRK